jgi:neurofibromin 1
VLYEYLAEASVVFRPVFPVIHSLLDAKINSLLALCHDPIILAAVQNIIQNMIETCDDIGQQQLHFLQTCGFGGLWRFAGPFAKGTAHTALDNAELFVNCLEAMVETCLSSDQAVYDSSSSSSIIASAFPQESGTQDTLSRSSEQLVPSSKSSTDDCLLSSTDLFSSSLVNHTTKL